MQQWALARWCSDNHIATWVAVLNFSGTRSMGAWISPGLPSWPQAAIWSSPLLGRKKTTHRASAKQFLNSIIFSSLVGLKWDPLWGLNDMRLILHGMPWTRSASLLASSMLQYARHTVTQQSRKKQGLPLPIWRKQILLQRIHNQVIWGGMTLTT